MRERLHDGLAAVRMGRGFGVTESVPKRAAFALLTARARPAERAMPRVKIIGCKNTRDGDGLRSEIQSQRMETIAAGEEVDGWIGRDDADGRVRILCGGKPRGLRNYKFD